ncbi:MAG: SsrA-binding protein SmpB [Patescibacteria group bacterium]|jgi:SsrA-binding protein
MTAYAENRKAKHDYDALETIEGGLELLGHETKSIRTGGAKLTGAYLTMRKNELWLVGAHVSAYSKAGPLPDYNPTRDRKVLISRKELESLRGKIQQKGLTLVPFSLYPRGRRIKLSFALSRGRTTYDKREKLKGRDIDRELRRNLHGRDE